MKTLGIRFIHVVAYTGVRSPSRLARAVVVVQSIRSSAGKETPSLSWTSGRGHSCQNLNKLAVKARSVHPARYKTYCCDVARALYALSVVLFRKQRDNILIHKQAGQPMIGV